MIRRLVIGLVLLSGVTVYGQTSEDGLRTRLIGKPLYLRGMWKADELRFDLSGQLQSASEKESWTVCGMDVEKVRKSGSRLQIEGERVAVRFEGDVPSRVPLTDGGVKPKSEKITLEIAAPSSGDYGAALDAVYANGLAELAPEMPFFWQRYARLHFVSDRNALVFKNPPAAVGEADRAFRVGGNVLPPRALKTSIPEFSEYARKMKAKGNSLISLVVDAAGVPARVQVARPIGMGLDEMAEIAVRQYQFAPGTRDGQPMATAINIEVNFQIF